MDMMEAITACRERLFAVVGRYTGAGSARSAVVARLRDDATTGWPSLGWTTTKSGPWTASWKDSPAPRPMRDPILKLLLICGCRFVEQQIAACGSTKVGCCE